MPVERGWGLCGGARVWGCARCGRTAACVEDGAGHASLKVILATSSITAAPAKTKTRCDAQGFVLP